MLETKVTPTCHNCGSQDIEVSDRDQLFKRTVEGDCRDCGYAMWVYADGSTWIPGLSDEILAEIEADADDDYRIAI